MHLKSMGPHSTQISSLFLPLPPSHQVGHGCRGEYVNMKDGPFTPLIPLSYPLSYDVLPPNILLSFTPLILLSFIPLILLSYPTQPVILHPLILLSFTPLILLSFPPLIP